VRVFLDTNVLVSALTTRGLAADLLRLVLTEHELQTGEVNLTELRRVLRLKMNVPRTRIEEAERLLREHGVIPRPAVRSEIPLRDEEDKWVVASAIAGKAQVLVTGDKDLLDLGDSAPLPIVSPRTFWEKLRKPR
jgi:putative PIN family toxin of toxin-antitoxin system